MESLWKALALAWHNLELVTVLRWIFGGGGLGTFLYLCKKIPEWHKKIKTGLGMSDRITELQAKDKLHDEQIAALRMYVDGRFVEVHGQLYIHQAQFMASIHTAGEPICLLDADRNMIYANPAYLAMTGGQLSDVLGTGYMDLILPADRPRIAAVREELIKNPHSKEGEVTFQHLKTRELNDTIYRTEPIRAEPGPGQKVGDIVLIIGRFKIVRTYMAAH